MSTITKQALEVFKTKRFSGRVQCRPDASTRNTANAAGIRADFISISLPVLVFLAYLKINFLRLASRDGHYEVSFSARIIIF
jgi:hypothetical protein